MASSVTELLLLGIVGAGIYYAYSSGMLNNLLPSSAGSALPPPPSGAIPPIVQQSTTTPPGAIPPISSSQQPTQAELDAMTDEEYYQYMSQQQGQMGQQGAYPPGAIPPTYPQPPPQLPPQYPYGAPPPGLQSSLIPMNVPQAPPYVSQTVGTYSPYSPYNQFNAYQQYTTPSSGIISTWPDDNRNFSDIDTSKPGCSSCKYSCSRHRYGYTCLSCRNPCKKITHVYRPPQSGWDIKPVGTIPYPWYQQGGGGYAQPPPGYSPYGGYLGEVADLLSLDMDETGGATFAEMDDYHKGRRFDCHNKLKKRVHGKNNQFVAEDDYYNDFNRIQFNIE